MQKSINFFHNNKKILSSLDNILFVKNIEGWEKLENINVIKSNEEPSNNKGNDGDYYIRYDEIYNLLNYSENFNSKDWELSNIHFNNMNNQERIPYEKSSVAKKMIPNKINSTHEMTHKWLTTKYHNYWTFSIYVSPQEFKNFQIILSNHNETDGLKVIYEKELVNGKVHWQITENKLKAIESDIDNDYKYGCVKVSKDYYRAYISCKFNYIEDLKITFSILDDNLNRIFSNQINGNGIIINSAQLTNEKVNNTFNYEYVCSDGYAFSYQKYNSLYKKNGDEWVELPKYNAIHYGEEEPYPSYGNIGDIYFQNPFIKIGNIVRFGKNPLLYAWKNNNNWISNHNYNENDILFYNNSTYKCILGYTSENIPNWKTNTEYNVNTLVVYDNLIYKCNYWHVSNAEFNKNYWTLQDIDKNHWKLIGDGIYYTLYEKTNNGNELDIYQFGDIINPICSGVYNFNENYITITINNESFNVYRDSLNDTRFLIGKDNSGIMFWNKENETYGYINNEGDICNLKFNGKSLYNIHLIIDALTFSTNLFMQSWDSHCTTQLKQFQYGINSGGHGNFWDYNNLRKYY